MSGEFCNAGSGGLTSIASPFRSLFLLAMSLLVVAPAFAQGVTVKLENAKDRRVIEQLLSDMVVLPEGNFRMGDVTDAGESDEQPVRTVHVRPFAIARYEVTFEQFDVFARATNSPAPEDRWGRGRRPVIDVTWHDAEEFVEWLSEVTGLKFRLPSESEWEYAARGGTSATYMHGEDEAKLCEYGNLADSDTKIGWRTKACSDGYETTAPAGTFKPNGFDLYDMQGNVWEWVQDCWYRHHKRAPEDSSPRLKSRCDERVQRGGSWFYGADEARASYRTSGKEDEKSVTTGFRVARDL